MTGSSGVPGRGFALKLPPIRGFLKFPRPGADAQTPPQRRAVGPAVGRGRPFPARADAVVPPPVAPVPMAPSLCA